MPSWDEIVASTGIAGSNPFFDIVPHLDPRRLLITYARKSDPKGHAEHGHYLAAQERIPQQIKEARFEGEILILDEDTGISAWLGRKFRSDLRRQHELIESGR